MKPTIYLGADHAGFDLKTSIREHLETRGFEVEDLGAHTLEPQDDYPQYAEAVAEAVLNHPGSLGILACGNAEGICIAANKFEGIRAGVGYSMQAAETLKTDDNANIICLPGRIKTDDDPLSIVDTFIQTDFSKEPRHARRLEQVANIEERQSKSFSVVPAVLAKSKNDFYQKINHEALRRLARVWQIDILDGSMFDATSWADVDDIAEIKNLPELELHLMVQNPLPIISAFKQKIPSLRRVIIHAEINQKLETLLRAIKSMELEVGLAINPETSIESIKGLSGLIDLLLIMGVNPGESGQKFLGSSILSKICSARCAFPNSIIAVDGGINLQNAKSIIDAGARQLCVASSLWQSASPETIFQKFKSVLSS